jgi:hypothetical protein
VATTSRSAARNGSAVASSVETPTRGRSSANESPLARLRPTRRPVKAPGPRATAIPPSAETGFSWRSRVGGPGAIGRRYGSDPRSRRARLPVPRTGAQPRLGRRMSRWRETPPPAQVQPMSAPSRLECRRLDRRPDKSRAGRASTVTGILAQIHRLSAEAGHQCSDDANERRPRLARCSRRFGAASIVLVNTFDALRHLECGDTGRRGVRERLPRRARS